jgi:uncharacterized protein YbjT (DUF2867 family)
MTGRRVLLVGATGLVGRELLGQLLEDPDVAEVVALVRRPSGVNHPKLTERIGSLEDPSASLGERKVDQVFCALGTTIKEAGSQERFREVDFDYPMAAARYGRGSGATHYLLVSALGADSHSRVFYNRVKGEVEHAVSSAGFRSVTIARPSLLLGPRPRKRTGEELAKKFGWLVPAKYKPIEARDVARALVEAARRDEPGVRVLESREMRRRR